MKIKIWKKYHAYASLIILIPFFITVVTGSLLMLRHYSTFVRPERPIVSHKEIKINFSDILENLIKREELSIRSQQDISKVVLRPNKGLIYVYSMAREQIVLDGRNGRILSIDPHRVGFLISLHEGIFFGKNIRDFVFFPSSILLLFIGFSGMILLYRLYILPKLKK